MVPWRLFLLWGKLSRLVHLLKANWIRICLWNPIRITRLLQRALVLKFSQYLNCYRFWSCKSLLTWKINRIRNSHLFELISISDIKQERASIIHGFFHTFKIHSLVLQEFHGNKWILIHTIGHYWSVCFIEELFGAFLRMEPICQAEPTSYNW